MIIEQSQVIPNSADSESRIEPKLYSGFQCDGWDCEPFELKTVGDKLVGRGSSDDKVCWWMYFKWRSTNRKDWKDLFGSTVRPRFGSDIAFGVFHVLSRFELGVL